MVKIPVRSRVIRGKRRSSQRRFSIKRLLYASLRPRKARKQIHLSSYDKKTLIALILFAPVGLPMMWHRRCGWASWVKYSVTGFFILLAAAVLLMPMPNREQGESGIQMISAEPESSKFGPPLPIAMIKSVVDNSVDSPLATDEDVSDVHYVYAADGAECYHEYDCKFAFASAQRLTVYEAHYLGFRPCGRCKPPIFDGTLNGRPNDGTE